MEESGWEGDERDGGIKKKHRERIGSKRGGGCREMTGRVGNGRGESGGDLEGCASVTWQAVDEGRLAANEREEEEGGGTRQEGR